MIEKDKKGDTINSEREEKLAEKIFLEEKFFQIIFCVFRKLGF